MPPFYLKLEFLSQIAVRFDVCTIGKWIMRKGFISDVGLGRNTSHVDLIIGEDVSPIGWALPPNISL